MPSKKSRRCARPLQLLYGYGLNRDGLLGRHHFQQNFQPHPFSNHRRRIRGNRRRASITRHQGSLHRFPFHPRYRPTQLPSRSTSSLKGDSRLPCSRCSRHTTGQERHHLPFTRHLQPFTERRRRQQCFSSQSDRRGDGRQWQA